MLKPLKYMVLALLCLLFTSTAWAETYYKITAGKYVVASPQPVLLGKYQALVTNTGVAPAPTQYYVKKTVRTVAGWSTKRYVRAVPNPVIAASNQSIVTNPTNVSTQQGYANQTPPPGTPTPPPTTPVTPEPETPALVQFVPAPPPMAKFCAEFLNTCTLPTTGVRTNPKWRVWYGNASKWHMKKYQQGSVACTNSNFGGEPTSSYKRCFYVEEYYMDQTVLDNAGTNMAPTVNLSLTPTPNVGFPDAKIRPAAIPAADPNGGAFRISCNYAFMSNDDPIVFPGVPNATHHHTFFGNTAVTAFSTNASLRAAGNSTCAGGILNRSGYWMPSLINTATGAPQKPDVVVVYYKTIDAKSGPYIKAPPAGLRMIAGKAKPQYLAQSQAAFMCQDLLHVNDAPAYGKLWGGPYLQACGGANELLRMIISFPQCWDGVNLDSPDHQSHMKYACGNECENAQGQIANSANSCPASHPIAIPNITINADFRDLDKSATYRLSSDNYPTTLPGGYSLHADWMNGWDETIIDRVVKGCINSPKNCEGPNLGDGYTLWGVNTE